MHNLPQSQIDRVILAVFAVLSLSLVSATIGKIATNYRLQGEIEVLAAEVEVLRLENQNLKYRLDYYASDEFVELSLKDSGKLVRPGENLVFLEKDIRPDYTTSNETEVEQTSEDKSNLMKWIDFFKGV